MIYFGKHHKKINKKMAAFGLAGGMLLSLFSEVSYLGQKASAAENNYGLSNPVITEADGSGTTTWDSIYFGHYRQEDTNGDGKVDENDEKQPIKWRVLSVDGDDAFLMADQGLDCKTYNDTRTSVTWETCTLRSWLNGYNASDNVDGKDYSSDNFINTAFTAAERSAIQYSWVVNADNPTYGTEGGNGTLDRIYLLSLDEVSNKTYGFYSKYTSDSDTRGMRTTEYARRRGAFSSSSSDSVKNGCWWLRTVGSSNYSASEVGIYGPAYCSDNNINDVYMTVRPVLHLNLSNTDCWSYAGKVSSDKRENIHNPQVADDGTVTWDCVYFGNYYQNDTNGDGTADTSDSKQPIKWRVLSVSGTDAFLMADQNLDVKPYNETTADVTWETCTLRSWLNGYTSSSNAAGLSYSSDNFINTAFTTDENSAINLSWVENNDNPQYGTEGGNGTLDKVYLLSIDEASNQVYGFNSTYSAASETRESTNTVYTYTVGKSRMNYAGAADFWWLRSPGNYSYNAMHILVGGQCYAEKSVSNNNVAVRPVLHLNLSSSALWSYGGTVSAKDSSMAVTASPIPTEATQSPTPYPTATQSPTPYPTATQSPTPYPTATQSPTPKTTVRAATGTKTTTSPKTTSTPDGKERKVSSYQAAAGYMKQSGYLLKKTVKLTWKAVEAVDGYYIYRREGSAEEKKLATLSKGTDSSYEDSSVQSGKSYTYRVLPYSMSGTGSVKTGTYSSAKTVKLGTSLKKPKISAKVKGTKLTLGFVQAEGEQFETQYRWMNEKKWKKQTKIQGKLKKNINKRINARGFMLRVRSYAVIDGKKKYSKWSAPVKIK